MCSPVDHHLFDRFSARQDIIRMRHSIEERKKNYKEGRILAFVKKKKHLWRSFFCYCLKYRVPKSSNHIKTHYSKKVTLIQCGFRIFFLFGFEIAPLLIQNWDLRHLCFQHQTTKTAYHPLNAPEKHHEADRRPPQQNALKQYKTTNYQK